MKIYNPHVNILVYLWWFSYEYLNWSYIQHEILGTMYDFMIFIYRVYDE